MNLMAIYGYSIQIYCDFSGYSDMAIGLAALMGFRLPINFNSPYKAVNITEFWRRWHISLSSWLRDYLYISLGGNRRGKIRTYVNLMLTMLLGGLWHGAATKFIIWGGLHGLGLAVHKGWMKLFKSWSGNFSRIFGIVLTFHFVAFCWLYFRADDMETVRVMLKNIGTNFNFIGIKERITAYDKVFSVILVGFILHYLPNAFKSALRLQFIKSHMIIKVFIFALVIFITYQATSDNIQPFIYFQF
jgi:D-alanyl-lipoteichoic acid acyltransferase DltB (MBOAT superfamily)